MRNFFVGQAHLRACLAWQTVAIQNVIVTRINRIMAGSKTNPPHKDLLTNLSMYCFLTQEDQLCAS